MPQRTQGENPQRNSMPVPTDRVLWGLSRRLDFPRSSECPGVKIEEREQMCMPSQVGIPSERVASLSAARFAPGPVVKRLLIECGFYGLGFQLSSR